MLECERSTQVSGAPELGAPRHGRGLLVVISGPSGVGKGAILARALARLPRMRKSVSVTTRPHRPGEVECRDYYFRSKAQFARMVREGEFLEHARYLCYHYGTPRTAVEQALARGEDIVLEIDVQGARQMRALFPEAALGKSVV